MQKVLITGAAGFIGSHLCEKFIEEGFEVYGLDNLITGDINNLKQISSSFFNFKKRDVTQPFDKKIDFDLILHFSCPASPPNYMKYPIETLKANSIGTFRTIELAKECNARYIFASSSEVYGDPLMHPQKEDYWGNVNPNGPRSVYDEAKRFSEAISMAYYNKGVDIRIARIFNIYGPRMRMDDGRVVPNFVSQAIKSEPITIYGNGKQTRSFCYISDLVEGIRKISLLDGIDGEVFNLGNPEEHKILDLAKLIIKKIEPSSKIVFKPLPPDDPQRRRPDINKAKNILKWEPKISLEEGLIETINFFRGILSEK